MPNNRNKRKRAASPCVESSSVTPIASPEHKKSKKNKAKAVTISSIKDVKPKVSGGLMCCVGEISYNVEKESKDNTKYLRSVLHDKTGEFEIDSKRSKDINKRAIDNGTHFKVEFDCKNLKKQSNPRYNYGSNKFIVYDPVITQLTSTEERKYRNRMGFPFNPIDISSVKDQDEEMKVDLFAKVLNDEIKSYTKFNKSWQSRKFKFADLTGASPYFSDDLLYKVPDNGIVALKNVGIEKNGSFTNIVGGHFVSEDTMNAYLSEEIEELLKNIEKVKTGGFEFVENDFMECSIRKFLQKRKQVYSTQTEINEDYMKIKITADIISLDNPSSCTYYSRNDDFKAIKTGDLDDYEDSEIKRRYKLELEFSDSSKKHFDMMLFDVNANELIGKSAEQFMKLSEKKQQKIIDNLSKVTCDLFIISKYETDDSDVISLKSRICKLIKQ